MNAKNKKKYKLNKIYFVKKPLFEKQAKFNLFKLFITKKIL